MSETDDEQTATPSAGIDPFAPLGSSDASPVRRPGTVPRARLTSTGTRRGAPAAGDTPQPPSPSPAPSPAPYAAPVPQAPPELPATPRRHLGSRVILAAALVLLVAVGGAALLWRAPDPVTPATPEPGRSGAAVPAPPVPLAEDSEYIETKVLDEGDLLVSHWIRTSRPVHELSLGVPPSSGLTADTIDVLDLTVAADGATVEPPARQSDGGWSGVLPETQEVYVSYRLSGVLQRSGSAAGRALATLTSLTLRTDGPPLAMTQTFPELKVLTLACLASDAGATTALCGMLIGDTWTVSSPADAVPEIVIAQLDLTASQVGR